MSIHDHTRYYALPEVGGVLSLSTSGGTLLKLKTKDQKQCVLIHHYSIQSESDGQTVFFYQEGGTQIGQKWVFNAREGVAKPFVPSPGFLLRATQPGMDIGLNLANSTAVDYELIFSLSDESMWANWQDGAKQREKAGPLV